MELRSENPYNKRTVLDQWVAYEEGKVDQHNADRASISVEHLQKPIDQWLADHVTYMPLGLDGLALAIHAMLTGVKE